MRAVYMGFFLGVLFGSIIAGMIGFPLSYCFPIAVAAALALLLLGDRP